MDATARRNLMIAARGDRSARKAAEIRHTKLAASSTGPSYRRGDPKAIDRPTSRRPLVTQNRE